MPTPCSSATDCVLTGRRKGKWETPPLGTRKLLQPQVAGRRLRRAGSVQVLKERWGPWHCCHQHPILSESLDGLSAH